LVFHIQENIRFHAEIKGIWPGGCQNRDLREI
jgi:hypothetical protein